MKFKEVSCRGIFVIIVNEPNSGAYQEGIRSRCPPTLQESGHGFRRKFNLRGEKDLLATDSYFDVVLGP